MLFLGSLVGHLLSGWRVHCKDEREHGASGSLSLADYTTSGAFLESLFENWESEFLQMAAYVVLTIFLFQRGSADSKDPDGTRKELADEDPRRHRQDPHAPGPVRRGGWRLRLYSSSLSIALLGLFAVSFVLHLWSGARFHSDENALHGEPPLSVGEYLRSSEFWFESFQNWQSEFLSVAALVVLSIYLRQHGSPESKPVHFAHDRTGKD